MTATTVVQTVTGRTLAELVAARDRAVAGMIELRLDGVRDVDVAGALAGRRTPVIVTCRARWEGGAFDGSEEERLRLLQQAVAAGAEYVDVEWKADRRAFASRGHTRLVISHHDFSGIPDDLTERIRAMQREGADVIKVAVAAARLRDCLVLGRAMRMNRPHVAIAMGPAGQLTRLCPWIFGSQWTYGGEAAPGQVPVAEMIDVYRVPQASAQTGIYAVAGAPLAHSASPAMHNAVFAALDMDAVYIRLETADPDEFLEVASTIGVRGASVTAPLKPGVRALVTDVDALSAEIGALNTLRAADAGWRGRNFDVEGFLGPLRERRPRLAGLHAVILGAGGAARTAVWALRAEGVRVEVSARRPERAAAIAEEFGVGAAPWPPDPGWDVLVNTTPVGTWPEVDASPLERDRVQGGLVYDLIYNPDETRLLRWARDAGAETIGGIEMLVNQAWHQFEWWTGRSAPAAIMKAAADAFVTRSRIQES